MKRIAKKWTAEHRGLVIAVASIIVFALLLAATIINNRLTAAQQQKIQADYVHTLKVLVVAEEMKAAVNSALRGERGYLITNQPIFLRPFEQGRIDVARLVSELSELTEDNPVQNRNIARLKRELALYLPVLERTIALVQSGQKAAAVQIVASGEGRQRIDAVLGVLNDLEAEERRLLEVRGRATAQVEARMGRNETALALIGLVFVMIAGFSAWIAHKSELHAHAAADDMKQMAMTDALTGIANRRAFFEALEVEVRKSAYLGQPLTLAVMDIDYFKRINDNYGHPAGDDVLQVAAKLALEEMRAGDLVGRIGGEEFAVLMPGTNEREAHLACERLRQALERRAIILPGHGSISITLSMGLAELARGEGSEALFARADAALFEAKAGGRNQIRLAA